MARTLNEIADEIEKLNDTLGLFGQSTGGVDGRFEVMDNDGHVIDILSLADDIRYHANNKELKR